MKKRLAGFDEASLNDVANPMTGLVRTTARKLCARFGLLGVAFRIQERLRACRSTTNGILEAEDGLPIPGPSLIVSVGGQANVPAFLEGGRVIGEAIREMLHSRGVTLGAMSAILDFGCGCGRVLRQWRDLPASVAVHGTDYNKKSVEWCVKNLPFTRCAVNRLVPPLDYEDDHFDFVYAFSVFTHLSADLQIPWIRELARVTRPGGYVLITVHGEYFSTSMVADEKASFSRGDLVVRHARMAGSNMCAAFHPISYLKSFAPELDFVEHLPARLAQDVVLFRKPWSTRKQCVHARGAKANQSRTIRK